MSLCDGMGGLADGELASATVIREFDQWFINKLPGLLETPEFPMDELRVQWDDLVMRQNKKLAKLCIRNRNTHGYNSRSFSGCG